MNTDLSKQHFKCAIQKIFNNWSGLHLAVEHGMGGRHGQKIALDILNYVYEYCIQNENITNTELEDLLQELLDQELNTICEDNSISEISSQLLKYLDLCIKGQFEEVDMQLNLLPQNSINWLDTNVPIKIIRNPNDDDDDDEDSSSDESYSQDEHENEEKLENHEMEVDHETENNTQINCDPGWTIVKGKHKR